MFNLYRLYDEIIYPQKVNKFMKKISKDTYVNYWDICNIDKIVINAFEEFCKLYSDKFITQWILQQQPSSFQKEYKDIMDNEYFENEQSIEPYRELNYMIQYLNIRKENKIKYEHIERTWCDNLEFTWSTYKKDDRLEELNVKSKKLIDVKWYFDFDVLHYKIMEVEEKSKFSPIDIENELDQLDKEYAMKIIKYKNYIWD